MIPQPDRRAPTPLECRLITRINATGPITVGEYMTACLLDPEHGYYATRDPFGAGGDFTTAPEISQMFGELIGLSLAQNWLDQGSPAPFVLAELGPGRGTLMADALRAAAKVPGFVAAAELWLVEASPHLRKLQETALATFRPQWAETVARLPQDRPLWLVANEFFDALPMRQFVRAGGGWRERVVTVVAGRLGFALTEAAPLAALASRIADTRDGDLIEICPAAGGIVAAIANRIAANAAGAALIIDYGGWRSLGDTLQGLGRHRAAKPLQTPGEIDLTAHVDFEALAAAAAPLAASGLTPQGEFLTALGIGVRAQALAQRLSGPALASHRAAVQRLTAPAEMGALFQVLGLAPSPILLPPGVRQAQAPHG